jgi:UPF0755 protein
MTVYDAEADRAAVEYEPFPEPRKRGGAGRTVLKVFGILVVLGLIAGGLAFVAYQRKVDPPGPPGAAVKVTIPLGSSTQRIGTILAGQHVITSSQVFRIYTKVNGGGPFLAGEYTLARNMSMAEAIAKLKKGPDLKFERLTVPEGLTLPQIAAKVGGLEGRSADTFLQAAKSGAVRSKYQPATPPAGAAQPLEGLLLPETYNVEPKDDEAKILERMVGAFDDTAADVGIDDAQAKVRLTPYQAIVVASLIERETRFDEERPKVARVIYNRLDKGMLLGIDATVIYAIGKSADRNVRVLFKDLEVVSPYNTYKVKGLPPTPIAAPGRASLEAALHPADGPWIYYVVTEKDGRHSFAVTAAEHEANKAKATANGVR